MGDPIRLEGNPIAQCLSFTRGEKLNPLDSACFTEMTKVKGEAENRRESCSFYMQSFALPNEPVATLFTLVCKEKAGPAGGNPKRSVIPDTPLKESEVFKKR
jgi:hypothetical protein